MAKPHSIPVGSVFSCLTYLGQEKYFNKTKKGLFRCSCGTEKYIGTHPVFHGKVKSCGCKTGELIAISQTTHGMSKQGKGSTFLSWNLLSQRCYNPKNPAYKNYGARGVIVCDRWRHSFENFLVDMGARPEGTTLDRINNDGNYEPANCRWATRVEQNRNTRRNKLFECGGEYKTLPELAEMKGISYVKLRHRVDEGVSLARALTDGKIQGSFITHEGLSMNISDWARHLGLNIGTLSSRLRRGMSVEEALRPGTRRYPRN